jgi:sialate O-acetylesterase
MRRQLILAALVVAAGTSALSAQGFIQLGAPFGEHMVLQQGEPIAIWGSGCPGGDSVKVWLHGQNRNSHCDWKGNWMVVFSPMKAGGPYQLLMEIGGEGPLIPDPAANGRGIELNDVLIGEVVLAPTSSGAPLSATKDGAEEIAAAKLPWVRLYKAPVTGATPGVWTGVSPNTAGNFPAAAYALARELYNKLKVPIGVVDSTQGVHCSALQAAAAPQLCAARREP